MRLSICTLLLIGLFGNCFSADSTTSSPRVQTPLGPVEGFHATSFRGRTYEAFTGIPFAKPPVGELRFEAPQAIEKWTHVFQAKKFSSPCIQYDWSQPASAEKVSGAEDCLYLNVYTPSTTQCKSLRPVIVFIPGGGFTRGSGNTYKPDYLMDREVTYVSINYRVGSLGFLSTGDDGLVAGNQALKDTVMALRWINQNIESFCGDPGSVTVIGQSAGARIVNFLYLTKWTKDLFHRGVSLSGTAFGSRSLMRNPLKNAQLLAKTVGCPTDNNEIMVECLKKQSAKDIVKANVVFTKAIKHPTVGWGPAVEKVPSDFTFMDQEPHQIVACGLTQDKPWVSSVVDKEALFPIAYYPADPERWTEWNRDWEKLAPYDLYFDETIPIDDQARIARKIKKHYLDDEEIGQKNMDKIVRMCTDRWYHIPSELASRAMAKVNKEPVYALYFDYRGAHSLTEMTSHTSTNYGVSHVDDSVYVFGYPFDPTTTKADLEMQKYLLDLWVNFATNGTLDAGVEWPRLDGSAQNYTYLRMKGPKNVHMETAKDFASRKFWDTLGFQEHILKECK